MDTTLDEAVREALASAPTHLVLVETLELNHPALDAPKRYCKCLQDTVFGLEDDLGTATFKAAGFTIGLSPSGENGFQELQVGVPNVDREISDIIETLLSEEAPVEVIYRWYLSNDLSQPKNGRGIRLFMNDLTETDKEVTGRATFAEIVNRRWPIINAVYDKTRFPALIT